MGKRLTDGLVDAARNNGYQLSVTGAPSMWYMRIADDDSLMFHQQWIAECVRRGAFFTNHHNQFMCCAMTDEDISLTLEIADDAFKAMKKQA
jgi:glutamate-1-semialdehyde 2,1-aminomutase